MSNYYGYIPQTRESYLSISLFFYHIKDAVRDFLRNAVESGSDVLVFFYFKVRS